MHTHLFSILIPAYNAGATIEQSIRSALFQTETNLEVLVVNDGSTDDTEAKALAWQQADPRVRYWRQENAGPGAARNRGLDQCRGDYVLYLDADDWIEPDYLEQVGKLLDEQPEDIIVSGYVYDFFERGTHVSSLRIVPEPVKKTGTQEVIRWIPALDEQRIFAYSCGKVYRRALIEEIGLRFGDSRFGEDYEFNLRFFEHVKNLRVTDRAWCHYQKINGESLTSVNNQAYYETGMRRYTLQQALLEKYGCLDEVTQRQMANVHMKTLLAAIVRSQSGSTFGDCRRFVRALLKDPVNRQAVRYGGGNGLTGKFCLTVLGTRSVTLTQLLGGAVGFSQQHLTGIYRKLIAGAHPSGRKGSESNE